MERGVAMRSSWIALVILVACLGSFATTSLIHARLDHQLLPSGGHENTTHSDGERAWPCCDSFCVCTRSIPPICQCLDLAPACHPRCKHCEQSPLPNNPPLYQCKDMLVNFCKQRCTPESRGQE